MKRILTACTALLVAAAVMAAQEAPKKYGVKSGMAKATTEMMGQKIEAISYFDDYGAKETSVTSANGMEVKTVTRDGKSYMVMGDQVQEVPAQESINYLDLTPEIIEKYKIVDQGTETILGRPCTKYSLEVSQMGQTAKLTVSVWNGYAMKAVTSTMGMTVAVTVTEFSECDVDPALFAVPGE